MEKEILAATQPCSDDGGEASMLAQRCSFDDSILQHDITYVK